MSWNNQNGPWGSDRGSGGWGSGPGSPLSGGPPQNPLGDAAKAARKFFQSFIPGGKKFILLGIAVVAGLWLASGFYTVGPQEQGVVLRFGEYVTTTQPGLNYVLPRPIEEAIVVPVTRTRNVEIGFRSGGSGARNIDDESLMLTGDENIIDVNFVVQWVIGNAGDFVFNLRNPDQNVRDSAESVMREIMGRTPIEFALAEGRGPGAPAGADPAAGDPRPVQDRHRGLGAAAPTRGPAAAGDRRLPGRPAGARRPGTPGERGAGVRQPDRAGGEG